MSILSENLRYLRADKNISQRNLANELIISRGRYSKYEEGKSEPPLEILQRISRFFQVSIDLMISADLRLFSVADLVKIDEYKRLVFIPGSRDESMKINPLTENL
ncbi:helix-turn-helix domain-containing protein [Pedobacter sp. L105]|uniref:helix-turn-helix domain-containing protein n=1 Tax=Pedobacter sp. L105 TaxID=1641871 RepID=UPI00131B94C1|nr:helix-turn-helix transcriptional regulator [Pedobacter sp. L105]